MRIISGKFKGKKLLLPNNKITRPLKDMTKESIFNLLQHTKNIKVNLINLKVLDIFAGVGSFGLECLSRGAKKVIFIENYEPVIKILEDNIKNIAKDKDCKILKIDFFNFIKNNSFKEDIDLIFLDPPFKNENTLEMFEALYEKNILKKNGLIIIHRHKKSKEIISEKFQEIENRTYGISNIKFFKLR